MSLFVGNRPLLGDLQSFIPPSSVDQRRGQPGYRIAKHCIEQRAEQGVETTLELQEPRRGITHDVQQR
jgi:hypothetical protein